MDQQLIQTLSEFENAKLFYKFSFKTITWLCKIYTNIRMNIRIYELRIYEFLICYENKFECQKKKGRQQNLSIA